eukprot:maker-scaffold1106_size62344-snap-gene-0.12 protein:Tk00852 transcript:maker-scaffold1106_size62344-snap-gene-0.12-mRNA-1 annotation:"pts glucose transporter subunit iia"
MQSCSLIALIGLSWMASALAGMCPEGTQTFEFTQDMSCLPFPEVSSHRHMRTQFKTGKAILDFLGVETVQVNEKRFLIGHSNLMVVTFDTSTFKKADGSEVKASFVLAGKGTDEGYEISVCSCKSNDRSVFCQSELKDKLQSGMVKFARSLFKELKVPETKCKI